jgi:hypothetical protein
MLALFCTSVHRNKVLVDLRAAARLAMVVLRVAAREAGAQSPQCHANSLPKGHAQRAHHVRFHMAVPEKEKA